MTPPHITTDRRAATTRIGLAGEIDLAAVPALGHAIHTALAAIPAGGRLRIDLAGVTFLDCAGITALLAGRTAALARDITYQVTGARGIVARVLHVLDLDQYLDPPAPRRRRPARNPVATGEPAAAT